MAPKLGPLKNAGQINGIPIGTLIDDDYAALQYNVDNNQIVFASIVVVDSIRLMAGSASIPDDNPANFNVNTLGNGLPEIFIGYSDDDEQAFFTAVLPVDYLEGTIFAMVEWSSSSTDITHGAMFEIYARLVSPGDQNDDAIPYIDSTEICLNNGEETSNATEGLSLSTISGDGRKIQLKLKRDKTGEGTNTLAAEAKVAYLELSFLKKLILQPAGA